MSQDSDTQALANPVKVFCNIRKSLSINNLRRGLPARVTI